MELSISAALIFRIIASVGAVGFLALVCLFPVNDRPTSSTQFLIWVVSSIVVVCMIFGQISFQLTA